MPNTSQRIIGEFLQIMAVQIEKEQLQGVTQRLFSLMIDEITDAAVLNEMVIYARYIENSRVSTSFLKICELFNGTTGTTLVAYTDDKGLSMSKMVGLGSQCHDWCTQWSWSKVQITPTSSYLYPLCHRLALAAAQAGNDVLYICNKFKPTLSQLP